MRAVSRRALLRSSLAGSLLFDGLLSELLAADRTDPLAPRKPHFPGKAKSVTCAIDRATLAKMR